VKTKPYVTDKGIAVQPHWLRFKVIEINGPMAFVEFPNGEKRHINTEGFEEDFDFPLKWRKSKNGKIHRYSYTKSKAKPKPWSRHEFTKRGKAILKPLEPYQKKKDEDASS
jgi:hypothetical protein